MVSLPAKSIALPDRFSLDSVPAGDSGAILGHRLERGKMAGLLAKLARPG